MGIREFVRGYQPWTNRPKAVASFTLVPGTSAFHLVFALADVVHDAIAGNVRQGSGALDVGGSRPITMPSSTSQSDFFDPFGKTTGSFGPLSEVFAF